MGQFRGIAPGMLCVEAAAGGGAEKLAGRLRVESWSSGEVDGLPYFWVREGRGWGFSGVHDVQLSRSTMFFLSCIVYSTFTCYTKR